MDSDTYIYNVTELADEVLLSESYQLLGQGINSGKVKKWKQVWDYISVTRMAKDLAGMLPFLRSSGQKAVIVEDLRNFKIKRIHRGYTRKTIQPTRHRAVG